MLELSKPLSASVILLKKKFKRFQIDYIINVKGEIHATRKYFNHNLTENHNMKRTGNELKVFEPIQVNVTLITFISPVFSI